MHDTQHVPAADNTDAAPPADSDTSQEISIRDATFAHMFRPHERVWLIGEAYNEAEDIWRLDFIRKGHQGRWMIFRYGYDVATSVVYFMGARPISDEELSRLRRSGRVFPTNV
jgi:hypothetical protein